MKMFKFCVFVLLFTFYFLLFTSVHAQSVPNCGYLNEPCCNFAGSAPDSCKQGVGLKCENHVCVSDGTGTAPTRNDVVGCSVVSNDEFHSLRPYPAKPCVTTTTEYAKFCGNTLTLQSEITVTYQPRIDNCVPIAGGKVRCSYVKQGGGLITINLKNAELPIMGNTEDVTPNATPDMPDAQKVNEYVSWYLNGVINKKEYPPSQNNNQIVNYTGPINRLLPSEILEASRAATVKKAKITRHDQIVGCVEFLGLGKISACESNNILQKKVRLSDWINNLPPERSQFLNEHDYQIEYLRWRGNLCIEIFGLAFCFDSPWKANWPGKLFSNIPLSSTEDLEGSIYVDKVSVDGPGISNIKFDNQTPAKLFFPHIQESDELGSILQDTYLAKDEAKTGADTAVTPPSSCKTVDVRSNKGDSLHAGEISGNLSYTASFTCDFNPLPSCSGTCVPSRLECKDGGGISGTGTCSGNWYCCNFPNQEAPPPQTCSKTFSIALSTQSKTPKIDDVWSRLVAGPTAIVKRIFPKLGTQIGTLKDMPGSASISYSGSAQGSGELNLPHIGGISEYFLKGIQTMLRPKGYGEAISFGETTSTAACGDIPDLPAGSGACKLTSASIGGITLPPTMVVILEAAAQTYNTPPGLILGVMFGEGAFNPSKYDWTEDNVKKWSMGCASMPNCFPTSFPTTGVVPFIESEWNGVKDAIKTIDPNREPNPCNLLDASFALAKELNQGQNGSISFTGKTCYGIPLNASKGGSASCSWDSSDYETAIRVWEFGNSYNSTYTCATKPGSCATGGGVAAACPGGDLCEKVGGSGNTSHNACVWNVAHSH